MRLLPIASALLAVSAAWPAGDQPSADEQAAMISAMRDYAAKYREAMPNFVCTRVVQHFESGLKRVHWRQDGKQIGELSVTGGQERIQTSAGTRAHWPLDSLGEFGADVTQVLNPRSDAHFTWSGWDTIAGQRVASFHFDIDQAHSTKTFSSFGVTAKLAYRGTIWADPATGTVLRVHHDADDIPSELEAKELEITVDYATVFISGQATILPVHAVVESKDDRRWIRNDIQFRNYREFQADSKITFGPPAQP